jgi:HTH-like domain
VTVFDHIRPEAADYSVQRMCALLGVSRSGYYDHLARQGQPPPADDERLVTKMRAFQSASRGTYGTRRLHRELVADGEPVGRRRVRRLMREHGIVAVQTLLCVRRPFVNTQIGALWTPRSVHRGHRDRCRGQRDRHNVDAEIGVVDSEIADRV